MNKIILKRVLLSCVLISMIASLFIGCQNAFVPDTTVPENKVELPEEYRKLIGTWKYSTESSGTTPCQSIIFTETYIKNEYNDREPRIINIDVKKMEIQGNRITIYGEIDGKKNIEWGFLDIINENKIKTENGTCIYTRKTDTPSEGGTTPEGGSIDASKFYGSWSFTPTDNQGKSGTLTFNEDGSFSYNGEAAAANGTGGTYTLSGNTLTMKYNLSGQIDNEESLVLSLDINSITLTAKDSYSNVFNRFFMVDSNTITLNKAQ